MPSDQKQQAYGSTWSKAGLQNVGVGHSYQETSPGLYRLGSPDSWMMVDDRQGGLVAQRLVRYQTLSTAVQKKIEWCGWPGMKTPLRPCRVLDHQDWKKKTVLHQEVCNTSKKNTITIPILPSCNHQISPLMGTAHPLPTSRRWQDQAQRRLGSCRLQVVDVACRLGLLQSMLGLSQGPQDAE